MGLYSAVLKNWYYEINRFSLQSLFSKLVFFLTTYLLQNLTVILVKMFFFQNKDRSFIFYNYYSYIILIISTIFMTHGHCI